MLLAWRNLSARNVSVPTEVADFERGHLSGDLPQLSGEEDRGPDQLQCGPDSNCERKCVVRRGCAYGLGQDTAFKRPFLWSRHILEKVFGSGNQCRTRLVQGLITGLTCYDEPIEADDTHNERCDEKRKLAMVRDPDCPWRE